ncbi:unnamed protein product [Thelazia callipaeda]|uniref:Conserved oligomeric Golgi complex subunit 7 n=1 Tax=Thelazia callipaeda TaxID=103827 RepID=A0A0N5D285_THECL|nr:unnamed protein product [Thelazia callipaeda]
MSETFLIEVPTFSEPWDTANLVDWINSRTEPVKSLLEAVDIEIKEEQSFLDKTKDEIERTKNDESCLDECVQSCVELRERLKMVVDAHAKEQLVKEFDAIAVYDKADGRAADLIKILMARRAWKENALVIENLNGSEPAPENVVFGLQKAYECLSQFRDIPEQAKFLEKAKDIFLSWYSTRVVLAIQSENPVDGLLSVKEKYKMLQRNEDFDSVIKHYVRGENKVEFHVVDNLSNLFLDTRVAIISSYSRLLDGWAEKVLDSPNAFLSNALSESILIQKAEIKSACTNTIGKTLEHDSSGSQTLKMIFEFRSVMSQYASHSTDDEYITECIVQFGELLLSCVTDEYTKLATSFLANCSNIAMSSSSSDPSQTPASLEQLSNSFSQLIQESCYLIQMVKGTFNNIAVIFLIPAYRVMYENVVSVLTKFYKTHMDGNNVKEEDILRLVSTTGQLLNWIENDKQQLKDMLEQLGIVDKDIVINRLSQKLCSEISNFRSKLSSKVEGDISLAKARSEIRKMNKRFIVRAVEVLSRTLITDMENGLRSIVSGDDKKSTEISESMKVLPFGTSPNEFVTAAGVSLLSLAHQLSAYAQDSCMASAITFASKMDAVDDIPSWWIGKCAAAVQECFVDTVGDINAHSSSVCRQLSIDYTYLADVFEDLGTKKISDFVEMRQTFVDCGYLECTKQ